MFNKEKNIVIVLDHMNRGGAETQALYLIKGLIENNYKVHLISFGNEKGSYWEEYKNTGANIHLTKFKSKILIPPFSKIRNYLVNLKYSLKFKKLIRELNPYAIIPYTYQPNLICNKFWKYTKAKKCIWNQRDEGRMFLGRKWELKFLNNSSTIISNSLEGKLFLEKYTKRNIKIIHNGIVLPKSKIEYGQKDSIKVVMVANLHGYKDHITLLKAWKKVITYNSGKNLELVLAGSNGNTSEKIFNFIKVNNLQNSVKCIGVINDVNDLLLSSDIGVFSSKKEGLPNGILECMAVGLPVVETKINGSIEALGEDYNYLSPENNDDLMAEMLLELILDHKKREEIGKKNRERIKKNFTLEKMVNSYISLIE